MLNNEKSFSYAQCHFQEWTERIGFQEKMWCGCATRWRAGSDCLVVSSCSSVRAFRFLLVLNVFNEAWTCVFVNRVWWMLIFILEYEQGVNTVLCLPVNRVVLGEWFKCFDELAALFLIVLAERKLNVYFLAITKPVSWNQGFICIWAVKILDGVHNKLVRVGLRHSGKC